METLASIYFNDFYFVLLLLVVVGIGFSFIAICMGKSIGKESIIWVILCSVVVFMTVYAAIWYATTMVETTCERFIKEYTDVKYHIEKTKDVYCDSIENINYYNDQAKRANYYLEQMQVYGNYVIIETHFNDEIYDLEPVELIEGDIADLIERGNNYVRENRI